MRQKTSRIPRQRHREYDFNLHALLRSTNHLIFNFQQDDLN